MAYKKAAFLEVEGYRGNEEIPSGDDEFLLQKIAKRYPGRVGFLKSAGVNDDLDRLAFTPYDIRELSEIEVGIDKVKIVTDNPSESYKIKDGKLIIEAPKLFWSISKYLIVMTD